MSKKSEEINVLEHELVPKHTVISEEEKQELLKKYGIKETQLPKILSTDPVVKALKAKIGDVIKIERINPLTGKKSFYYRIVVEG